MSATGLSIDVPSHNKQSARLVDQSAAQFINQFGYSPDYSAYAPGRVTVIGGHTDYNGGLVISAALPRGTAVSVARNYRSSVRLISDQQSQFVELVPAELSARPDHAWTRYVVGILLELGFAKQGVDISISSDLPMQRGLASSAALAVATLKAVAHVWRLESSKLEQALLCQQSEYSHVGVRCGLLDPYTALHGTERNLLLIDCRAMTHQEMSLPSDLALIVCDTGVDRKLSGSEYNLRRAECQLVAEALGHLNLREATFPELKPLRSHLTAPTRRAEHVIHEIERVKRFWRAMQSRDYAAVKHIMAASHQSARDLFECSHPELDRLVDLANESPACVGSRLTGAGWGGATVNLVYRNQVGHFVERICQDRWFQCF